MSDLGSMKALAPGEHVTFAIAKVQSIRANASLINATRGRRVLTTKIDRVGRTITVYCLPEHPEATAPE